MKLPHRDETIVVPVAPKWREYASGLSLYAHRTIRRYTIAEARNANVVDDLLASKVRLLEIMRGEFLSRRRTVRVGQRLARIEGVGRVAQAGTSASTTVRNSPAHDSGRRKTPTAVNDGIDLPIAAASAVVTPLVPRAAPTPMRKKKGFRP
ncbi:MAG: hypothetical protein JST65_07585 [Acidobacteria bacterium]|nr:hypothetical protein [Acidobacteriota bacterium]